MMSGSSASYPASKLQPAVSHSNDGKLWISQKRQCIAHVYVQMMPTNGATSHNAVCFAWCHWCTSSFPFFIPHLCCLPRHVQCLFFCLCFHMHLSEEAHREWRDHRISSNQVRMTKTGPAKILLPKDGMRPQRSYCIICLLVHRKQTKLLKTFSISKLTQDIGLKYRLCLRSCLGENINFEDSV